MNPHSYNITVRRANFDGEVFFEARVKELPDVAEYADTADEAYALAIDTIEATAEIFAEKGKAMPAPYEPADDFSGRVTLRLAKSLHRSLTEGAEEEGVSLNQHIVNILSYSSGFCAATSDFYTGMMSMKAVVKKSSSANLKLVHSQSNPIGSTQQASWH